MAAKPKIAVLGGGFAGLETAFYLRHRVGDKADLTLVTDQDHFLFKPNTISRRSDRGSTRWSAKSSKSATSAASGDTS